MCSKNKKEVPNKSYEVSPSSGPFFFRAWLELTFPIAFRVQQEIEVEYNEDAFTKLTISLEPDIYKAVTGNKWHHDQEFEKWVEETRKGKADLTPPSESWIYDYIHRNDLSEYIKAVNSQEHTRYVHIEEVPTAIYLSCIIPDKVVPGTAFSPHDINPKTGFFTTQVLPSLRSMVDAYRIAALPAMRYMVLPISELMVNTAHISIANFEGKEVGKTRHGFDVRGNLSKPIIRHFAELFDMESRYHDVMSDLPSVDAENQITSSYYLFHMRRWTEAITLASAVTENLTRELVFELASTTLEGEAMYRAYRYKEIFNKVFPAFGRPKLSDDDQNLWIAFVEAKEYRGAKVHGEHPNPFDTEQEKVVKKHLQSFHDVSRWLKNQMGSPWKLDIFEDGKRLDAFP